MICPNCGGEASGEKGFCSVCGARFDPAASQKSAVVKKNEPKKIPEPAFVPTEIPGRKGTVIGSSFVSGTVFAIMGFVLYVIFLGGVIDETEASVSLMLERAFGFSDEVASWAYISMLFLPMLLLPIGFIMFASGADHGKTSGAEVIKAGVIVQLVCTLINFIANCMDFIPDMEEFFESVSMRLEYADEFSRQYEIVGMAFFELFFAIIHPFVFLLWLAGVLQGISAVSRRIKYGDSSSRPSGLAASGGNVLGVLRILMVVFIVSIIIIEDSGKSIKIDMEGYMVIFGYIFISIAMMSFSSYLSYAGKVVFCGEYEPARKMDYEAYAKVPEPDTIPVAIPVSSPSPVVSPEPSGKCSVCGRALYDGEICNCLENAEVLRTCKFCIYCMKPLREGELCSCAEARAENEKEAVKSLAESEKKLEYIGDSRVSINIKHRPAPGSPEAKEMEEGAKMFTTPGDL